MKAPTITAYTLLALTVAGVVWLTSVVPVTRVDPGVASQLAALQGNLVDEAAQNFTLPRVDGAGMQSLEDYRGRWVFLNFWASWCAPCREEMPSMRDLAQRLPDDRFVMVGISEDEDMEAMTGFLSSVGVDGTHIELLVDQTVGASEGQPQTGAVAQAWGSQLLPETWLIDPEGRVVARFQGGYDWTREEVVTLLDLVTRKGWRG